MANVEIAHHVQFILLSQFFKKRQYNVGKGLTLSQLLPQFRVFENVIARGKDTHYEQFLLLPHNVFKLIQ